VFEACYLPEERMAKDHRRLAEEVAQGILLDNPSFLKEIVERVLQELLEAEMTEHVGAAPYERTTERKGHRNGHKPRTLRTRVGTLNLFVPQDREGTFSTRLFSRYQRNEKALVLALMEMYVEGISTRKVKDVTEELCGTSFSKSLVSSLAGRLDAELEAWRSRPLEAASYPYLFVDARYEKVRVDGRVVNQGVLVVSGVRDDGFREIFAVEVADTESEATYQELFRSLKRRGLSGVELIISDDHEGLKAAIARHFQGASHQRCQVHYSRNLLGMVGYARRKELGLRTYERSSPQLLESKPSRSPLRWPRSGARRVTRRCPSTSRSTSKNVLPAWPSRRAIGGASAQRTASNVSTRR
jgi:putative transposase